MLESYSIVLIVPPGKNWIWNCIKHCQNSRPNRRCTFKLYLRSQIYFCGTHLCDGIACLDITPLDFSISAVCSSLCEVLQQSQLHKFHFDFFRLCGRQFCECASFTAVRKFHRRVAHLSSLRACLKINIIWLIIIWWSFERSSLQIPSWEPVAFPHKSLPPPII